jgi:hypothetical protein
MKFWFLFTILFLAQSINAQLYLDRSDNLPSNGAQSQSTDVKAVDLDMDGDIDVVLANEFQSNTILHNNGSGQFVKFTSSALVQNIHDSEDVVVKDLNNDGFPDLFFCSEDDVNLGGVNVHEYYIFDGNAYTSSSYHAPDSEANALISFDVNKDGFYDLFFGNKGSVTCLINNGDGEFTDESNIRFPVTFRTTQDLLAIDVDNDDDFDLFEANENGNILYINNGQGVFTDESSTRLPLGLNIETRKASKGDIDNDGDEDIFLSNVEFINGKDSQNRIFLNDGNGVFTDETTSRLPFDNDHTIDAIFEDVDFDGDLDLFVANVFGARLKVYQNNGVGFFSDGTDVVLGASYFRDALGVISADFNGDGFNDIYLCDRNVNSGNKDILLMRKNTTAIKEESLKEELKLYPSPASDTIFLNFPKNFFSSIGIHDSSGKRVYSIDLNPRDSILTLNLKSTLLLIPGTYIVRFNGLNPVTKTIILLE